MTSNQTGAVRKPRLVWFLVLFAALAWIAILEAQILWQGSLLRLYMGVAPGLSRQEVVGRLGRPYLSVKDGPIAGRGTRELYYKLPLHALLEPPDFVVVLDSNDRVMSWCFTQGPATPLNGIELPRHAEDGAAPATVASPPPARGRS